MAPTVAKSLPSLPAAHEVLEQGFEFRPRWWLPRVPDAWGNGLSQLPSAASRGGYHRITRRNLLSGSRPTTPDQCGAVLVRCFVWGTGNSGFLVPRRARVFRDTLPAELGNRLLDAASILREDGACAAYESLDDHGRNRIKFMRASFFTKFLYAADADEHGRPGAALILDQFVALALNELHSWGLRETGPWSSEEYGAWLDFAHRCACESSEQSGSDVRPDAVEMAYFEHGRSLARQRRARHT